MRPVQLAVVVALLALCEATGWFQGLLDNMDLSRVLDDSDAEDEDGGESVEDLIKMRVFPVGSPRIVGGDESVAHAHPHQVGMFIELNTGQRVFCGGSLLTPEWVITAAHCTKGMESSDVILGAHGIREQESSQQKFSVVQNVPHPEYGTDSEPTNDIALLKLNKPATLNEFVKLTRIPPPGTEESYSGREATMTGWGRDSDSSQGISPVLREAKSKVISNTICDIRYGSYFGVKIRPTNICTQGVVFRGTCNGDSGGPLTVVDEDGSTTLVGITSFGISFGCEKSWPPVFTRVSSYNGWIEEVTGGGFKTAPTKSGKHH